MKAQNQNAWGPLLFSFLLHEDGGSVGLNCHGGVDLMNRYQHSLLTEDTPGLARFSF